MSDAPPTSATPTAQPAFSWTATIALLIAIVTLGVAAWQWFDQRVELEHLRQELAKKLAESDLQSKESRLVSEQVREATKEAQVKIGVLEAKLAESQSQQVALEALYQELSRNRDEWSLAEIEQSLLIASQQIQLAGNVRAALIALQNADTRLQRMDRPQFTPLRKAINRDMERLKAVPYVDVVGISARLDALISAIDTLPLATEMRPVAVASRRRPASVPGTTWTRFWQEAWNDMVQLVRVERMDKEALPLLSPPQGYFLRENLRLRLIGARLALLTRDETSYKDDLEASRRWITRYYDTHDRGVANALSTLRALYESEINIRLPDMASSVDAVRSDRAAHERSGR